MSKASWNSNGIEEGSGGGWDKALKYCGVFILNKEITGTLQQKLSQITEQFIAFLTCVQEQS